MIWGNMPGFYNSDSGGPRWGDSTIIADEFGNVEVIDGYCGIGTTRLIKALKKRKIKSPYLYITHAHYDHYYGIRQIIRDSYFTPKALYCYDPKTLTAHTKDIRENIEALTNIINEAKTKNIPVVYLKNGNTVRHGEIKFTVYRDQPSTFNGNSDAYVNDGSLCFWFPEIKYLITGDAGLEVAKKNNLDPVFIKIGHHGNNCVRAMATWLKNRGCKYCWDNDYSTKITDFLKTGREDCLAVGMKYFGIHGDINFVAFEGKINIYKDGKAYSYACLYRGKNTMKLATLQVVRATLLGEYGTNNERTTALLADGFNPGSVQGWINTLTKLIKG